MFIHLFVVCLSHFFSLRFSRFHLHQRNQANFILKHQYRFVWKRRHNDGPSTKHQACCSLCSMLKLFRCRFILLFLWKHPQVHSKGKCEYSYQFLSFLLCWSFHSVWNDVDFNGPCLLNILYNIWASIFHELTWASNPIAIENFNLNKSVYQNCFGFEALLENMFSIELLLVTR